MIFRKYLDRFRTNPYRNLPPPPLSSSSFTFSSDDDYSDRIRRNKMSSRRRSSSSKMNSDNENTTTEEQGEDNSAHRYSTSSSPPPSSPLSSSLSELQRAFAYFETTEEILTRERVKKNYKRLSLVHHPDRNSNSEKSIREMQAINHYYGLLEGVLDRKEEEEEDVNEEDPPHTRTNNNDQDRSRNRNVNAKSRRSSSQCRRSLSRRRNSNTSDGMKAPNRDSSRRRRRERDKREEPKKQYRRRRRNSIERRQRKNVHEEKRQDMEQKMKEEWNDNIRKMDEFQRKQRMVRRKNRHQSIEKQLDTVSGRDQAYDTYIRQVRAYRNELNTKRTTLQPKIKYHLMDCCNKDIVVAMRLVQTDSHIAVEIIHHEINNASKEWFRLKMRTGTTNDHDYCKRILRVLINPLDKERNTILHYAVYLEDYEMISYLAQVAKRYHCFAKFVTYTNARGMNAGHYTAGCTCDSIVPALMTTLTKEATNLLKEKCQRTINNRRRTDKFVAKPYADSLFNIFLCLIVGRYVTCSGWIASTVITSMSHLIHLIELEENTIMSKSYFFILHIVWYSLREIFWRGWNLSDTFPILRQVQVVSLTIIPFFIKLRYWPFHLLVLGVVQIESSLILCLNWILSKNATMFTGYAKHLIDFAILSIPFLIFQQFYCGIDPDEKVRKL